MEVQQVIVKNKSTLDQVLKVLSEEENHYIAFDIETDGVEEHICNVIGIALTAFEDQGVYIPFKEWNGERLVDVVFEDTGEKIEDSVQEICETLLDKALVMHNGVFDIACIYHSYGINLTNSLFADTILMKHTVDEERPFGLKQISEKLYGAEATEEQEDLKKSVLKAGGKWNKSNKDMYMGNLDIIAKYAIKDVVLTLKVFVDFNEDLERQGLTKFFYEKEVMPLYREATIPMKLNGVYVNSDYFKNLKKAVEDDILKLENEVFKVLGDVIEPKVCEILDKNVRSSRSGQFAEEVLRLYELPVPLNKKTGKPTFAKSALQSLKADYPGDPAIEWLTWQCPKVEIQIEERVPCAWRENTDPESEQEAEPIEWETKMVKKLVDDPEAVEPELPISIIYEAKKNIYVRRFPNTPRVFNLGSAQHLSWLLFEQLGEEPKKYSKQTGQPTVDKNTLSEYAHLDFVKPLLELKKLEKMLSTYVLPILEKSHDGRIYPSMLQFGTTSGRYSCGGGLNLQTLPRDDLRIKRGFIAPPGYKIVAADFSSLEPRIFSWVSGDDGLKEVYWKDLDLYSKVAIDVFGLSEYSAKEGDENFLKTANKEMRHLSKTFTLAVPYGAGAGRIGAIMGKDYQEAKEIIDSYLDAYPGLKDYMAMQEEQAYTTGMVHTQFGRVRHLPRAKKLYDAFDTAMFNKKKLTKMLAEIKQNKHLTIEEMVEIYEPNNAQHIQSVDRLANELYYEFRNLLNNAKNFPIQSSAAHVTNASLIKLANSFRCAKIDGWIALQVHDEIVTIVREEQAEEAAGLLKDAMENNWVTEQIDVAMIADPVIGDNFAEAKD